MLEVRLLGQFDIRLDGVPVEVPSRPAQSLLAYLLLNPGRAHRRERLAGLLWPEASEANARGYLRKALWHLRKAIPPSASPRSHYWLVDEITIAFNADCDYWLDSAVLAQTLDAENNLEPIRQAVSVYRGELLPGFYDEWVLLERERLAATFEKRMGQLLDGLMAAQAWPGVLDWGERWIALGGAPEPAFRALMVAHAQQGDLAAVAATFQRCQAALARELGVELSEQTRALHVQLRAGHSAGLPALAALPTAANPPMAEDEMPLPGKPPFKGLQRFEPADRGLFFGREQLTADFVERLHQHAFLAVVGASGSGKSSLVRAGLVPALTSGSAGGGAVYLLAPGESPLEAVAACLAPEPRDAARLARDLEQDPSTLLFHLRRRANDSAGGPPVFVVDQFEELFTLCRNEAARQAFVDNLLLAAVAPEAPARVVIALRADFYGHCAQYPELRAALAEHQAYIGPMSAAELRRAIEAPARLGGWAFEPGLVDWVVREAGDEPGMLPLVSHALLETWQQRRGHTLTFQGYATCGGVQGAIAKTAERVFHHTLSPQQQPIARRVFLRLTELGEGTQDTRRRATLAELVPRPELASDVAAVLNVLAEARLVTTTDGAIEVAHEALIREWPALRQWLAEDRDGLRLHRRLTEAAQEWEALERDPGALLRGARLAQTLEWVNEHNHELNGLERAYMATSQAQAEGEAADNAARQRRELAAAQREVEASQQLAAAEKQRADESNRAAVQLRRRAVYLAGAVVLALLLTGAAAWLGGQARQAAAVAQANERVAFARELSAAAISNLTVDPERSVLLALQAVTVTYSLDGTTTTEAEVAVHSALQASRVERTLLVGHDQAVAVAFSPDGRRLATISDRGITTLWDVSTGLALVRVSTGAGPDMPALAFSPDGRRLATGGPANTARVWDVDTGQPLFSVTGHTGPVLAIAFNVDGTRLATASADGTARLWDGTTGDYQYTVLGHAGALDSVAFSPDGTRLASASVDGALNVWEVAGGRPLHLFTGANATAVAFSPDGNQLLGVAAATVTIWDAWAGQALRTLTLTGHTGQILDVALSPDGTRLATGSQDRKAIVWDAVTGQPLLTLAGNNGAVGGVAFSPDNARLATASDDGTARIWNIGLSREWYTQPIPTGSSGRAAMSPDGKLLAMGIGTDGLGEIWDALSGQALRTLTSTAAVQAVGFDPTGARLATASPGEIRIWDTATGQLRRSLPGPAGPISAVAFSHDGRQLVAVSADGTGQVSNAASGQNWFTLNSTTPWLAAAFSPDDRQVAVAAADGTTHILDSQTGAGVLTLTSTSAVRAVAFSPDGRLLATATEGGITQLWDAARGRVVLTLSGHTSLVMDVAFSADGKRLASASRDGTAKLWEPHTGELLLTLPGSGRGLNGVAFSPDGARLVTSGDDGIRAYLLRIEDLVALAQTRVTRRFTPAECQQYLHLAQCPVAAH